MNTFSRYILRSFLWQFLLLLIGFTALLQLFDLLNNSADILKDHNGQIGAVAEYALLRLPEIASFLTPFVVLMAALITLGRMDRANEILAYKAAGAPYFTILWAFLPAVGIVAFLHFLLADQIVPMSIQALTARDLTVERAKPKNEAKEDPLFVQDGNMVVEAGAVGQDGAELSHLRIYQRDEVGKVKEQVFADDARYDVTAEIWHLSHVWTTVIPAGKAANTTYVDAASWKTNLTPAEFSDLVEKPQAMTFRKIHSFATSTQVGVRPTYFYQTWMQ
jgi:lipopolysaccharide export system permease protein